MNTWGRPAWNDFHNYAVEYPANPSLAHQNDARDFFQRRFLRKVECEKCLRDYQIMIARSPPRTTSREDLFDWTVEIHNTVNRKLGKPEMTTREAYRQWNWRSPATQQQITPYAGASYQSYRQPVCQQTQSFGTYNQPSYSPYTNDSSAWRTPSYGSTPVYTPSYSQAGYSQGACPSIQSAYCPGSNLSPYTTCNRGYGYY